MKSYGYKRLESDLPLIRGHSGPVVDFEFSPFNDSLLATASEDSKIKLWSIPEEGITKDISVPNAELTGHMMKLILAKFHPSADYTMVSSSLDKTIRLWDVTQQRCVNTIDRINSTTNDLQWSHNGSLIGITTKDKNVSYLDPRNGDVCGTTAAHEGAKQHKLVWLGNSESILTCGFSKFSEREYAVWDIRNFNTPLIRKRLDEFKGVPMTFFDEEHKVVYIAGKGESSISFFQYSSESPNYIDYLTSFKSKDSLKGFSLMPKQTLDVMSNEVNRGVRLTQNYIEYISFKVSRRTGAFQPDLFPPIRSSEPAIKFDDYIAGGNAEPLRIEHLPDLKIDSSQKSATFSAKVEQHQPSPSTHHKSGPSSDEVDALNRRIKELIDELEASKQTVHTLKREVEELRQENHALSESNSHL